MGNPSEKEGSLSLSVATTTTTTSDTISASPPASLSLHDEKSLLIDGIAAGLTKSPSRDGESPSYEVDFENDADPANPKNWSPNYKWTVVMLISFMTLVVNLATIMCAPATGLIMRDFGAKSKFYNTIIVTIWELGEACAPLFIAPLSEMFGRRLVYNIANCLFVIFSVAGAVSSDIGQLLAFRFMTGASVASVVLNPCLVGDMFPVERRGTAMSIMGLAPILGPVTGPIIGGYMSIALGWRSTFWLAAIAAGVLQIVFFVVYRETYKPQILRVKAKKLQKEHGVAVRTKYEVLSGSEFILKSLVRPARMLFLSPILFLLAMYVAAVVGYLYLLLTSITGTFQRGYGFSIDTASLTFLGLSLGLVVGMFGCQFTMDRRVQHLTAKNALTPEASRIPYIMIGGGFIPAGLLWYGWAAEYKVHWIVPVLGLGLVGIGVALTILCSFGYLVDAYGIYAGSAIAANICLRCVIGALLPLAGPALYERLGAGWGNSVLALVAVIMFPVPFVVWRYGDRVRAASRLKIET